jgi:predicted glycogen debranching enzyme
MSVIDPRSMKSSTIIGLNTRKYHGLLVSATRSPVGRMVILSRVEETVTLAGKSSALATVEYPGAIHPSGHGLLCAFDPHPHPRWAYQSDGWTIEKSLRFAPGGPDDLVLTYTLLGGDRAVDLEIKPLLALRPIHELMYQWRARGPVRIPATGRTPEVFIAHDGSFDPKPYWYLSTIYRRERERGYAGLEDLWMPGTLSYRLTPGRSVHLAVSTRAIELPMVLDEMRREEQRHRKSGVGRRKSTAATDEQTKKLLWECADRFFVWSAPNAPGASAQTWTCIIPQFPWTPLAVRDMLIAMPGLLLVQAKLASARSLLVALSAQLRDGLIPSELSETGESPAYTACDTSLWFIHAVGEYLRYGNDLAAVAQLAPTVESIIASYRAGTRLGIGLDADGLLRVREPGIGSTWMNARLGQWVITPRHGRPVEVNALWYNALMISADLIARGGGDATVVAERRQLAAAHRKAFNDRFWNTAGGCCFDVVYDQSADASIRPNQLLSASLAHPVLSEHRFPSMLNVVRQKLLTPLGLRTLSADDLSYQGRYAGDVTARDRAYHNGCVYPWLLGAYASVLARASGTAAAREQVRSLLRASLRFIGDDGLGHLPELFDGDAPHKPGGAISDARAVGELARVWAEIVQWEDRPKAEPLGDGCGSGDSRLPNPDRTPQLT